MDECLWYKDNEIDGANLFLKKLKEFLKKEYPFVIERAKWMNKEWLNKGLISKDSNKSEFMKYNKYRIENR